MGRMSDGYRRLHRRPEFRRRTIDIAAEATVLIFRGSLMCVGKINSSRGAVEAW
jgi:hypothetical protein